MEIIRKQEVLLIQMFKTVNIRGRFPNIINDINNINLVLVNNYLDFHDCMFNNPQLPDVVIVRYELDNSHFVPNIEHLEDEEIIEYMENNKSHLPSGLDCIKKLLEICRRKGLRLPNIGISGNNHIASRMIKKEIDNYGK